MFVAINSKNSYQIEKLKKNFPYVNYNENIVLPLVHPELLEIKVQRIDRLVRMFKGKAKRQEYWEEIRKVLSNKYRS